MKLILRLALAAVLASLAFSGAAEAQQQYDPGGKARVSSYCKTTVGGDTPCPASPSFSATISGFAPTAGATTALAASGTSADAALPAGADVVITNPSTTVTAFFRVQAGAGTALTTDQPTLPGAAIGVHVGTATHISAITGGGSVTLQIQGGSGLATGYGGGGGTTANASVGTNGAANPASSTQMGVSDGTNLQKVVAPIDLGDGVNGNNMVSSGGWVWNGASWDRMPGTTSGVAQTVANGANVTLGNNTDAASCASGTSLLACQRQTDADVKATGSVQGATASGASLTENPLANGGRAATAAPTAVTDGQKVAAEMTPEGLTVVRPYAIKELMVRGYITGTDNAAHTIIASAGGSLKNYITGIQCYNTSATTITVLLSDAAGTTLIVPAGGGNNATFNIPLATAAATAFTFTASTGETTIGCAAQGYTGL